MATVYCPIDFGDTKVTAICPRCDHARSSRGTGDGSVRRSLILLKESCACQSNDFYVPEWDAPGYRKPKGTEDWEL